MPKIFSILASVCTLITPFFSKAQNTLNDSTISQLKNGIAGFKDRYHSPSIVVAIIHDKEIIFSESLGFTDVENKVPASINSKYPILSITKTFTATMFMQLYERNILKLDDDVKKIVPEYIGEYNQPGKSGTTLLQLATHTSGLPRNSHADINFLKQVDKWMLTTTKSSTIDASTKKEFIQSLKFITKEYPEYELQSYGDRRYSNLGYSLLGIALERAAKTDYAEYVIRNICQPLKMKSTGVGTETKGNNIIAKGYYYSDSTKDFIKTPVFNANSAIYAGGMYSTATDLARYISFQFNSTAEDNKILSTENKAMMHSFKIGWKPSYPFVLHEGSMLGYRSQVIFNPELKIGWVILTNTTDFEFSRINEFISKLITPYFARKPVTEINKYIGTYVLADKLDSIEIYMKNDSLYSSYLHEMLPAIPLVPSGYNRFKGQGRGTYNIGYEFIANEKSEITMLNLGQLVWIKK